jgi:hypothetical protein
VPRRAALWTGIDLDWTMPSRICRIATTRMRLTASPSRTRPALIRLSASEAPPVCLSPFRQDHDDGKWKKSPDAKQKGMGMAKRFWCCNPSSPLRGR